MNTTGGMANYLYLESSCPTRAGDRALRGLLAHPGYPSSNRVATCLSRVASGLQALDLVAKDTVVRIPRGIASTILISKSTIRGRGGVCALKCCL
jgi:hypothetical protein